MGKESKQIIRDPSSYLVAAILPMIFLLLFGYGITLDAGVMDIVILDESNSQSGLQLQENFAHSPNFRVHQARSRSEAGRMMRASSSFPTTLRRCSLAGRARRPSPPFR